MPRLIETAKPFVVGIRSESTAFLISIQSGLCRRARILGGEGLVGHGIGQIYENPRYQTMDLREEGPRLRKGMTLAVNMINGAHEVVTLHDSWTVVTEMAAFLPMNILLQ